MAGEASDRHSDDADEEISRAADQATADPEPSDTNHPAGNDHAATNVEDEPPG